MGICQNSLEVEKKVLTPDFGFLGDLKGITNCGDFPRLFETEFFESQNIVVEALIQGGAGQDL